MLMSLFLIPKFSLPVEQNESYSASRANFPHLTVLFFPSLNPAERISSTPDLQMDLLSSQILPLLCREQRPLYSPYSVLSTVTSAVEESIVWYRPPESTSVRTDVSANATSVILHLWFLCFVGSLERGLGRWVRL